MKTVFSQFLLTMGKCSNKTYISGKNLNASEIFSFLNIYVKKSKSNLSTPKAPTCT